MRSKPRHWAPAATTLVVLVVGGCASGSAGPPLAGPVRPVAGHPPSARTGPVAPKPSTTIPPAGVGETVAVAGPDGASASVAVAAVVDPASPANFYDHPGPGLRYVGVRLQIANSGGGMLQENVLTDTSVVDSAGATESPIVIDLADCPVFFGGEVVLGPHSGSATGCVTFEMAMPATVKTVHVALGGDVAGEGTWSVP